METVVLVALGMLWAAVPWVIAGAIGVAWGYGVRLEWPKDNDK